jgi:hypothetical protein
MGRALPSNEAWVSQPRLAGNALEYEPRLIRRIGQEAVDSVKSDTTLRKYTRDDLIEIARLYNEMARLLKKQHA